MRFFTPFLSVVTLVASAAPHAAVRGEIATRDAATDFLTGTQVGQGGLAARSISVKGFMIDTSPGTILGSARVA